MSRCTVCGRLPSEGCRDWCERVRQHLTPGIRLNSTDTHCGHGHEWTPENEYIGPTGERACRACRRISDRQRRQRIAARKYSEVS